MALKLKITAKDLATKKLRAVGGAIKGVGSAAVSAGKSVAKFGLGIGIVGAAMGAIAIKKAGDFQKGLFEIGTLMGDTAEDAIPRLHKSLLDLASSSGQALDVLAKANYDIVSAGFANVADSAELMGVSAQLAVGGVTEVSTAADLLTTALNSYKLTADDAMSVSDKLFTTVRLGKTTINEIAHSFGMMSAIAGPAGVSIDELGAALAVLTTEGQNTNIATTAIRAGMIELMKPSTELKTAIKDLGIEGFTTMEALMKEKGLVGALSAVKTASMESGKSFTQLFSNVRALMAVMPLAGESFDKFTGFLNEMKNSAGATTKAYELMQKTWVQNWKKFKMNLNRILIEIGDALITVIQPYVEDANKVLEELGGIGWGNIATSIKNNMENLGAPMKASATYLGKVMGDGLLKGWNFMIQGNKLLTDPLDWLRQQVAVFAMLTVTKLREFFSLPFESTMQKATAHTVDFFRNMWADIVDFFPTALDKMIELIGAFAGEMSKSLGLVIVDIADKINWLIEGLNELPKVEIDLIDTKAITEKFEKVGETIKNSMGGAMDKIVADVKIATDEMRGSIDDDVAAIDKASAKKTVLVLKFYEEWKKGYLKTNKDNVTSTEKLQDDSLALWEIYWAKVKAGAIQVGGSGDATVDAPAGPVDTSAGKNKKEVLATDIPAPNLSAFQKGLDAIKGAWSETWADLITQNEDGSTNWSSTIVKMAGAFAKVGKAIIGVGDAILNKELTNADEARKVQMANLDERLEQGIMTDEQYAAAKEKIDDEMEAKVKAAKKKHKKWAVAEALINGALAIVKAFADLGPIAGTIAAIAIGVMTAIQVATINAQTFAKGGLVKGMAKGGSAGYGTDTVPAMLTPGEYVMKKSAVDKYGTTFFEKLNKFQEGGVVTSGGGTSEMPASNINVSIQAIDAKSFYEWVAEEPEGLAKAINILTDRDYISMYNSGGKVQVVTPYGTGGL